MAFSMDQVERLVRLWIEQDRLERRRERARKRMNRLAYKRREEWLRRAKKEIENWENRMRAQQYSGL
jgi:hypothetical protein